MQTGTGLGLAIVNSIVRSSSVDGKIDVWSSETVGTEIKVTFVAGAVDALDLSSPLSELWKPRDFPTPPTITLINFDSNHRGVQLFRKVLSGYLTSWWHMPITPAGSGPGDIIIVNEDSNPVAEALARKDIQRPFILLSSGRGDPHLMSIVNDFENIGGFCRILYKPGGPSRLHSTLKLCLRSLLIGRQSVVSGARNGELRTTRTPKLVAGDYDTLDELVTPRRYYSDLAEKPEPERFTTSRSITVDPLEPPASTEALPRLAGLSEPSSYKLVPPSPTIAIGSSGTLLKSSVNSVPPRNRTRVLVVEDNHILRDLLWVFFRI
jgi:hypothetical protein